MILKRNNVKNILISYWLWKNCTPYSFKSLEGMNVFLDSGAFSAYNSEAKINIDKYIEFIDKHNFHKYVVLDVVGSQEKTMENLKYMESRGLRPIPVFQYGSKLSYLDDMAGKYKLIALGGLLSESSKNKRIKWCKDILNRYPNQKFHGFGATGQKIFKLAWHSVDSSSWYRNYADQLPNETLKAARKRKIKKYINMQNKHQKYYNLQLFLKKEVIN